MKVSGIAAAELNRARVRVPRQPSMQCRSGTVGAGQGRHGSPKPMPPSGAWTDT